MFQASVAYNTKTRLLICPKNWTTGFYIKYNKSLWWLKFPEWKYMFQFGNSIHQIYMFNCKNLQAIYL